MPNLTIPVIVKHCTIAIYRTGKIQATSRKDRFTQCLKIARSRLAQYGFVILNGDNVTDAIGLTGKGRRGEAKHQSEGRSKTVLFDTLYDLFDLEGTKAKAKEESKKAAKKKAQDRRIENKAKFTKKKQVLD